MLNQCLEKRSEQKKDIIALSSYLHEDKGVPENFTIDLKITEQWGQPSHDVLCYDKDCNIRGLAYLHSFLKITFHGKVITQYKEIALKTPGGKFEASKKAHEYVQTPANCFAWGLIYSTWRLLTGASEQEQLLLWNGHFLLLSRKNDLIGFSFACVWQADAHDYPGQNCHLSMPDLEMPLNIFLKEIVRTGIRFLNDLLMLNPKTSESANFQEVWTFLSLILTELKAQKAINVWNSQEASANLGKNKQTHFSIEMDYQKTDSETIWKMPSSAHSYFTLDRHINPLLKIIIKNTIITREKNPKIHKGFLRETLHQNDYVFEPEPHWFFQNLLHAGSSYLQEYKIFHFNFGYPEHKITLQIAGPFVVISFICPKVKNPFTEEEQQCHEDIIGLPVLIDVFLSETIRSSTLFPNKLLQIDPEGTTSSDYKIVQTALQDLKTALS